jgi:uncharacterized protein (DUF1015 family)
VPAFEPFRGLRYNLDRVDLADVTAPPYDVIDRDERAELVARHPDNVVQVDLPVADDDHDDGGDDPYAAAAARLGAWRHQRILVHDPEPSFYVYRMDHTDEQGRHRHTTGVIGALTLSPPGGVVEGEQPILPHEHTTPKAKSDRLELTRATGCNLSPVWGLSPSSGLSELLDTGHPPLAAWHDEHGVGHAVWQLTEPARLAAISAAIASEPIVIADGHHRYETALTFQREQRETAGEGPWDATLVYVVELAEHELTVLPIHRLLGGLPPAFDLPGAFDPFFELSPAGPLDAATVERMSVDGVLMLVTPDGAWSLRPRPKVLEAARDLDSSRLDVALAALPPHEVSFQHGVDHVVARIRAGDAQAGVLLRPATVAQIVEIARGGDRMPPKTTFFHPKPRTGVVFRTLR